MKIPFLRKRYLDKYEKINFNSIESKTEFCRLNFQELSFLRGGEGDEEDSDSTYIPT